jgi:hypothetical protein
LGQSPSPLAPAGGSIVAPPRLCVDQQKPPNCRPDFNIGCNTSNALRRPRPVRDRSPELIRTKVAHVEQIISALGASQRKRLCSGRANLTGVAVLYAEGRRTTIRPHNAKQTSCNCMGSFQIARDYKQIRWTTLRVETISLHADSPSHYPVSQSPDNAGSIGISDYNGACMSGILAGPWCDKILSSGESVTTLVRCAISVGNGFIANQPVCAASHSAPSKLMCSYTAANAISGARAAGMVLVRNPPST